MIRKEGVGQADENISHCSDGTAEAEPDGAVPLRSEQGQKEYGDDETAVASGDEKAGREATAKQLLLDDSRRSDRVAEAARLEQVAEVEGEKKPANVFQASFLPHLHVRLLRTLSTSVVARFAIPIIAFATSDKPLALLMSAHKIVTVRAALFAAASSHDAAIN